MLLLGYVRLLARHPNLFVLRTVLTATAPDSVRGKALAGRVEHTGGMSAFQRDEV